MSFAFVILHYLSEKDTIECIESIRNNLVYKDKKIIVVDNNSLNDSFDNIKQKYKDTDIIFIKNSENLGFAKGNNVGYLYAKNKLQADFIVLLNNDTVLDQCNFCDIIVDKFNQYKYFVLGPDIITHDGFHQNPMKERHWTKKKLKLFKLKAQLRLLDMKFLRMGPRLLKRKELISGKRHADSGDIKDVRLHGACLIFSPLYVKEYDGLDPRTFLYMEEDLLKIHMDRDHRLMMYSGAIHIYHKEDAATNMVGGSNVQKEIRFLNNLINSINVCIESFE